MTRIGGFGGGWGVRRGLTLYRSDERLKNLGSDVSELRARRVWGTG